MVDKMNFYLFVVDTLLTTLIFIPILYLSNYNDDGRNTFFHIMDVEE